MRVAKFAVTFTALLAAGCLGQDVQHAVGVPSESVPEIVEVESSVILAGDVTIEGRIRAKSIEIPVGATVHVSSDCVIHATEMLAIHGKIVCLDVDDPAWTSGADAPTLQLLSDRKFTLRGEVQGGRGRDYGQADSASCAGRKGGAGSTITISAPDLGFFGHVRAGRGGDGGPSGDGGDGGSLHVIGNGITSHGSGPARAVADGSEDPEPWSGGGAAGAGGDGDGSFGEEFVDGGDGGAAGDATWEPHPETDRLSELIENGG